MERYISKIYIRLKKDKYRSRNSISITHWWFLFLFLNKRQIKFNHKLYKGTRLKARYPNHKAEWIWVMLTEMLNAEEMVLGRREIMHSVIDLVLKFNNLLNNKKYLLISCKYGSQYQERHWNWKSTYLNVVSYFFWNYPLQSTQHMWGDASHRLSVGNYPS